MTFLLEPNFQKLVITVTSGLLPVLYGATAGNAPPVPTLNTAEINILSYSTGETYKIKSHITCDTFNFICMIQCRVCNLQYIYLAKPKTGAPKLLFNSICAHDFRINVITLQIPHTFWT